MRSGERAKAVVREALRREPLIRDGRHWRYAGRRFNHDAVNDLIAEGFAVRIGDRLVIKQFAEAAE